MSCRPFSRITSSFIALSLALGASGPALAAPVVIAEPVAPLPTGEGAGLCGVVRTSSDPLKNFGLLDKEDFIEGVNAFIDEGQPDLASFEVSTPLDLSNNNDTGSALSFGDFRDAVAGCPAGGCDFAENDPSASFGMRLRGYLAVPPEHVDQPLHFGFYADDAVAVVIYDALQAAHPVVVRPTALGLPSWRMTNTVTFAREGLYPIEILYVAVAEHSALEMSVLVGEFEDFELGVNENGSVSLAESGFTLVGPASFHRALPGDATQDEAACTQCGREFVGLAGNNGCGEGAFCNSAALCQPCVLNDYCGPSCQRCDGHTPRCALVDGTPACVACVSDADCDAGEVCDLDEHACVAPPPEPGEGGAGGAGGAGGGGGAGGAGGNATPGPGSPGSEEGGCAFRAGTPGQSDGGLALALAGLGIALARWRQRASARSGAPGARAPR
ncbi:outer membrane exchange protein TraA family protein [Sorangium sp. So ce1335]|uniref:outer membrane exchange protein TraA family protein n=1 Tax=Sorangium sp. So ce1335 TaxID=3133335 RepID=UPI003F61B973